VIDTCLHAKLKDNGGTSECLNCGIQFENWVDEQHDDEWIYKLDFPEGTTEEEKLDQMISLGGFKINEAHPLLSKPKP